MGQIIANRYRIVDKLGEGGMGTVYKADDRLTGDVIALKQIRFGASSTAQTPKTINRSDTLALAQEFRTLASLHHPNIIGVLDYGFEADQPYYAMQYLPNAVTIVDYAAKLDIESRIQLLLQLLQALAYIHRRGIVHRDIKPSNVLVSASGTVKLLDFGLAIKTSQASQEVVGTLRYIAPEVLTSQKTTTSSDLYSVGILAFELLTQKTPFHELSLVSDLIQAILYTPPDFTKFELDVRIIPILEDLLTKFPQNRYVSVQAVMKDLLSAYHIDIPDEAGIRDSFLKSAAFVGRETELTKLQDALKDARSGQGSTWLVGGESGVGKSRLFDELRIHAMIAGVTVLHGQAVEGGGFPFQVWRDVLRRLALSVELSDLQASVLKTIVPDISSLLKRDIADAPPLEGEGGQLRLIRAIVDILQRYCLGDGKSQAVLLVIEDLQWTIESLEPLKLLNRMVEDLPLLIVGNYRDDERADLADDLPSMQGIKLQRMSDTEIATLSQAMIGEVDNQEILLEFLQRETEGNVFFLVEVMRVLADEAGSLDAIGRVTLPKEILSETIGQIIQQRLAKLPSNYRYLLQVAAILGRQIDNQIIQKFADEAKIVLEDWFIACAQAAILELNNGVWRFQHDKLREGTLRTLSDAKTPPLYQRVAETIESIYPDDKQYALLLINLWRNARNPTKELHYIILQGMDLSEQAGFRSYQQAYALFQRGWDLEPYADEATRLDLLLGIGLALVGIQKPEESKTWFEQARELAQKLNQPSKKAWALTGQARSILHNADKEMVYNLLDEAVQLAQSVDDKHRIADVLSTQGYIYAHYSEFDKATTIFLEAGQHLREIDNQGWLSMILNNVGKLQQLAGEYSTARRNLQEAQGLALRVQFFNSAVLSTSNLGILSYFTKNYLEAIRYYRESIRLMKTHHDIAGLSHVWVLKLFAEADGDDNVSARESLQQAIKNRHDPESIFSNIYIVMGAIRLEIDDDSLQAATRLGLLYHLGGKDPFICEWLDPLRDKLRETLDETVLNALLKKGEALELLTVIEEIEGSE